MESEPFQQAGRELTSRLAELDQFFVEQQVDQTSPASTDLRSVTGIIEGYLERMNAIVRLNGTLSLYIRCIVDTDASDDLAIRRLSELDPANAHIRRQTIRFQTWLGKQSALLPDVFSQSEIAHSHSLYLQETAEQSRYLMSDAEESLAAELALSGMNAWSRLHGIIWSRFNIPFERDGRIEQLPISMIQNLAMLDPDGTVRQRAAEAEIAGWASMREPLTAALNGVKGATVTLNKRCGRTDALHAALDQVRLDRETLEVLFSTIQGSLPVFRRYLRAKAAALGKTALPWWDVYAPIGQVKRRFTFPEAQAFITTQFERFSHHLGDFSKRAFELN